MIYVHLDGAGPYGDPYQVNSDNNGPYGDAVTQELIPYIEKAYRAVGQPHARFLDGASTGGWVSLGLQIFYPDYFNGAWSQCPDPVDFRAYELVDIYSEDNVYVNKYQFERPSMRDTSGEVRFTLRHECQIENVMGLGNLWTRSGKDWCAWNAVFGPRGSDGLPIPLWEPKSGKIDKNVLDHWKKYDLRLVLEQNWQALAPRLRGKIHIWVGDADNYFLNNAVYLLEAFLKKANPPYEGKIEFAARQGHTTGWSEKRIMKEMAAAFEQGEKNSHR
jgi:S-formylglutathione hydrolase FrmB